MYYNRFILSIKEKLKKNNVDLVYFFLKFSLHFLIPAYYIEKKMKVKYMKTKCIKPKFFKYLIIFLLLAVLALILCDGKISRTIMEISSIEAKERSNEAINEALSYNISAMDLKTEDFFIYTSENAYSADMLLINNLSANVSRYISDYMQKKSRLKIEIPIGMLTGIDMLSNMGPDLNVYVKPAGAVNISTKSQIISAGINQVNYKIYFDVEIESKIVMPLKEESITFRKEILIVDTVIKGSIPEAYLNMNQN